MPKWCHRSSPPWSRTTRHRPCSPPMATSQKRRCDAAPTSSSRLDAPTTSSTRPRWRCFRCGPMCLPHRCVHRWADTDAADIGALVEETVISVARGACPGLRALRITVGGSDVSIRLFAGVGSPAPRSDDARGDRRAAPESSRHDRPSTEGSAQVGRLDLGPLERLALARAVPQFRMSDSRPAMSRIGGPISKDARGDELFLGDWRIVSRIEYRVRPLDRTPRRSDLRTSASSTSMMAYSSRSDDPAIAQALWRSNPPAKTEQCSSTVFSVPKEGRRTKPPRRIVMLALQSAPRADQQPEPVIATISHFTGGHRRHPRRPDRCPMEFRPGADKSR